MIMLNITRLLCNRECGSKIIINSNKPTINNKFISKTDILYKLQSIAVYNYIDFYLELIHDNNKLTLRLIPAINYISNTIQFTINNIDLVLKYNTYNCNIVMDYMSQYNTILENFNLHKLTGFNYGVFSPDNDYIDDVNYAIKYEFNLFTYTTSKKDLDTITATFKKSCTKRYARVMQFLKKITQNVMSWFCKI